MTMALRNPNKPHIKMVNGNWTPEYVMDAGHSAHSVIGLRNIDAWRFCLARWITPEAIKALEARGICSKR